MRGKVRSGQACQIQGFRIFLHCKCFSNIGSDHILPVICLFFALFDLHLYFQCSCYLSRGKKKKRSVVFKHSGFSFCNTKKKKLFRILTMISWSNSNFRSDLLRHRNETAFILISAFHLLLILSYFRYARTFIFFYSIGLHLLVFTCLYKMSALSYLR